MLPYRYPVQARVWHIYELMVVFNIGLLNLHNNHIH